VLLGLTVIVVTGFVCIVVDRLLGGTGIAGAAASSTAGNSAAVPQAVALADPSYALVAPVATIQVAASVIVTAIGTPLLTSWWYKRVQRQRAAAAPPVVVIETTTVTREVVELWKIDPKIDALFQLPLDEFTQKRNALAKELSGESKKQVKFLTKPPLPIWAVNQLFWHDRPTYNALIDASEKLRTAHRSLLSGLSGPKADVRKAEAVHRAALEKAVGKTIALLEQSQGQISDAARETVRKTLAALPTDEAPGRLTRARRRLGSVCSRE
jgi:hypothetical protein